MPILLRQAMQNVLEGWAGDLPPSWRANLGATVLGFSDMDPTLELEDWEPIFPVRRGKHFPGQPPGAHILRAYDGIEPASVRCVVLGQDPYPEPGFATGRAFEAGNLASWNELDKMFSKSVRAFMQLIVATRVNAPELADGFSRWPDVRTILNDPSKGFEGPSAIADRWVANGALLLNASLTLTRFEVSISPHQARGHLPLWRPLMLATITTILKSKQPVVFLGFGKAAADILAAAGISDGHAGHVGCVLREHPARADDVLGKPNPFMLCNQYLEAMGAQPIGW